MKDLTNMRFGYLTCICRGENQGKKTTWNFICDCGEHVRNKRTDFLTQNSMCKKCDSLYRKGLLLNPSGELHPQIEDLRHRKYGKLEPKYIVESQNRGIHWMCECDCGNTKVVSSHDLKMGTVQSCGCLHSVVEKTGTKYGMLTIVKKVDVTRHGKIKYLCKCECENTCTVIGSDLRNGNQISCGCIKSKGERKIIEILNSNQINFEKEATFDDCKDIYRLPFDFKINRLNNFYLIEYDGKQHFGVKHSWSSFEYEKIKKHDEIKNEWCKQNNITLIRIPYTIYDSLCIEDLIPETSKYIIEN